MTFACSTDSGTSSTARVLYGLKTALAANGWTVLASSNGATYNASGDAITSIAGMEASNAWFRIRQPTGGVAPNAGVREFTFQSVGAATTDIRIKYSLSAGFTGGVPGILRTPSASDERVVVGSGTDAVPVGNSFYVGAAPAFVAVETASPFAWYLCHYYPGGTDGKFMGFDPVFQAPFDSSVLTESDLDPYVIYTGNQFSTLSIAGESSFCHWYSLGETPFWGLVGAGVWQSVDGNLTFPGASATGNPYNSKADTIPLPWLGAYGLTTPTLAIKSGSGIKGFSKYLKYTALQGGVTIFSGDKLTVASTNDYIMGGNVAFPWNGS